jgi:hypothetical protein
MKNVFFFKLFHHPEVGEIDLLKVHSSQENKYITSLMEILFTREERLNGIVVDMGKKPKNADKQPLDYARVSKLKGFFFLDRVLFILVILFFKNLLFYFLKMQLRTNIKSRIPNFS